MSHTDSAVLITGAAGGIGTATVRRLTERGYHVFAGVRRSAPGLDGLPDVDVLPFDVTDPDAVRGAAERVAGALGDRVLRAVINNAGLIIQGPQELVPPADLRRQFEVNTLGPAYVTQAFLPLLRRSTGRVINVSAPTANTPLPFMGPISASKAALAALSEALRAELAAWDIPVVLIEPDSTDTPIFAKADADARRALADTDPARVALYAPHLEALAKAMAAQRPAPVEPVAKAIVEAVEARNPKRRYVIGRARMLSMLSRLPASMRESMIARTFGLAGIRPPAEVTS
ncbi:SDR family NAD(P)-dependent oxidoreductase [Pseudonocardia sp. CA-107938]|uniref:SDR family NAD(P)-dependent oxidoreductase n=1 Tax=Pseudonocardia sp. CA-107938 TaxID=3240021 RepID=UPI003D8B07D9